MLRKFRIDILSALVLVLLPGLLIWFRGDSWMGLHTPEQRAVWIVVLCVVFVVLFLWSSFDDSSRPVVAARRVRYWVRKQCGLPSGQVADGATAAHMSAPALRNCLQNRHGWRWRSRGRWLLVIGDEPLVKRLAPGLTETGYALTPDAVLIYANGTGETLDTAWLNKIRRLRRFHAPVDAIVAVTRHRESPSMAFDADELSQRLARHARVLHWAAPAYLLNVTDFGGEPPAPDEAIGFTWSNARRPAEETQASLQRLAIHLGDEGVERLCADRADRYRAELSQHIERLGGALSELVTRIVRSRYRRHAVHGLLFAPLFRDRNHEALANVENSGKAEHRRAADHSLIWQTIADHSREVHGSRVGFSPSTTVACITTVAATLWLAGTIVSALSNRETIRSARETLVALSPNANATQQMVALNELDQQIEMLETRRRDGAPWYSRFGLNRDRALLDALWPRYEDAAARILIAPIRQKLEDRLHQLASMSDAEIASGGSAETQAAYDTLKAYLMLANPERAAPSFLTPQLVATAEPVRPQGAPLAAGTWSDLREHTIGFMADHLNHSKPSTTTALAIVPDGALIAATRLTIIGVRGIQNSTDAIYQQVMDEATPKYPPVSLAALLGDTSGRGLFNTTQTVPGIYTRAAWEQRISRAIDEASEQGDVSGDWVLSDTQSANAAPSALKAQLRQRYFDDYGRAWAQFLNSLRWQPASTLSATADQLTLLADPQRSPLVALMNGIAYQAGTGASTQSLSDTLISKAQQLVGGGERDPSKQPQPQLAPLALTFAPILRLTGSDLVPAAPAQGSKSVQPTASGDLSLARYLERVTAMRLKIEQMVNSPDTDAMSRIAAQSVLQGRTSDIADSRDYASRVAASLGEQWAGFGQLLQAPLDQTWRAVVKPAAGSLNEIWSTSIVADWNRSFGGRYPFVDSDNEASLPEMARFMRPDNGIIARFLTTQLAGVVERQGDRWVAAQGADHSALMLDPAFLDGLNRLMRVSTVLFPTGDAHLRFDLRGVATPGIDEMKVVLPVGTFDYFNQQEEWVPFEWPGQSLENLSHIEWQTAHGGLRSAFDAQGRFGVVRLLERAKVSQQDNARYLLTWTPDASEGIELKVQLRSDVGAGPLDVLNLRHYTLPGRIFMTSSATSATRGTATRSPPPLPPEAVAAAQKAAMPLPEGAVR